MTLNRQSPPRLTMRCSELSPYFHLDLHRAPLAIRGGVVTRALARLAWRTLRAIKPPQESRLSRRLRPTRRPAGSHRASHASCLLVPRVAEVSARAGR